MTIATYDCGSKEYMTLGEKIAHLRIVNNISQEELARKLNVSRQSISKLESD